MKKVCFLLLFSLTFSASRSEAQCNVDTITNTFYRFLNPGSVSEFTGFLCITTDSVGTAGVLGYYDGNGFTIKLIAGTEVVFSTDSCNGNQVSMTIVDSADVIIPGAYSSPACSNTLDFIAPYTGKFTVVLNLNGVCGGSGTNLLGQLYVKIKPGTTAPACSGVINDTICGAIQLQVGSGFSAGNTADAYPSDPMDSYLVSIGATTCSTPNNTMWYYLQSQTNIDTLNIWVTSGVGSGFHSWISGFHANSSSNFCTGGLTFLGCTAGAADDQGIDTMSFQFFGVLAGEVYVFMIDGFNGGSGPFSIALMNQPYTTSIEEAEAGGFNIYPNPATNEINIRTKISSPYLTLTLSDITGKTISSEKFAGMDVITLKTGHLSGGIYFITVKSQNGVFQKKVCISNGF